MHTHTWNKVMRIDVFESPSTSLTPSCAVPFQMQDVYMTCGITWPEPHPSEGLFATGRVLYGLRGLWPRWWWPYHPGWAQTVPQRDTNFQVLSQRSGRTYGSFTGTVSSTVYSHVLYSPHMYKIDIFKIGATCALLKIITKTRGCVSLDKQVNISFAALLKSMLKGQYKDTKSI